MFERALLRRERRDGALVLTFGAAGGTHEAVRDLARREAACCPFLDYRVQVAGDEVIWTISGSERAVDVFSDAVHVSAGAPNQVVRASGSPVGVPSPTQAT